jgi:hypothetical protein
MARGARARWSRAEAGATRAPRQPPPAPEPVFEPTSRPGRGALAARRPDALWAQSGEESPDPAELIRSSPRTSPMTVAPVRAALPIGSRPVSSRSRRAFSRPAPRPTGALSPENERVEAPSQYLAVGRVVAPAARPWRATRRSSSCSETSETRRRRRRSAGGFRPRGKAPGPARPAPFQRTDGRAFVIPFERSLSDLPCAPPKLRAAARGRRAWHPRRRGGTLHAARLKARRCSAYRKAGNLAAVNYHFGSKDALTRLPAAFSIP